MRSIFCHAGEEIIFFVTDRWGTMTHEEFALFIQRNKVRDEKISQS